MKYINEYDAETMYDEMLDENGPVMVCGMAFSPSRILKELDSVAYNCGLADYLDACGLTTYFDEADEE